jgi:ribosome-associated protein
MYQAKSLAKKLAYNLDFHKGENVVLKNVEEKTPLARFYLFVGASNSRKINGLKEQALEIIEKAGASINHIEGKSEQWIIIDVNDIVVHIMTNEAREKYKLDLLYKDCPDVDYSITKKESK